MPSLARNERQGRTCGVENSLGDDGEQSECVRRNSVVACLVMITHVTLPNWVYVRVSQTPYQDIRRACRFTSWSVIQVDF